LQFHCSLPEKSIAILNHLELIRIKTFYLDELADTSSIGLKIIGLVVAPQEEAVQMARIS
jgi:predicted transposase YdaD